MVSVLLSPSYTHTQRARSLQWKSAFSVCCFCCVLAFLAWVGRFIFWWCRWCGSEQRTCLVSHIAFGNGFTDTFGSRLLLQILSLCVIYEHKSDTHSHLTSGFPFWCEKQQNLSLAASFFLEKTWAWKKKSCFSFGCFLIGFKNLHGMSARAEKTRCKLS